MKLSESHLQTEVTSVVADAHTNATVNATAGDIAKSLPKTETNVKRNARRYPGKLLLRHRLNLVNDAESATDSSEHFTEHELNISIDKTQQQTQATEKQRNRKPRAKRDIINLRSNLSPKYIGSPTTVNESDDNMRKTRRRNHESVASSSFEQLHTDERDNDTSVAALAVSPKTIVKGTSPLLVNSSVYLSPIDRLLIKNGASSPNSTGFEADAEDAAVVQPTRKQLKRKLKRGQKPKNVFTPEKQEEITVTTDKTLVSIEANQINEDYKPDLVIKPEIIETDNGTEDSNESKKSEQKVEENNPVVMSFVLPDAPLTEIEHIKSPPDLNEPVNNSEQLIKSPSSISIDSAKGSSIVTDSGWPTYQVGDLYWGKLFSYCYWPCMICPDEYSQIVGNQQVHPQRKSTDSLTGGPLSIQVHVRFFADNGRHNWVKSENLLPFAGLKAFEAVREDIRIKHGAKSAKYRQMVAKQSKLLVWRQAVDEAFIVSQLPYDQRLEKFQEIIETAITVNKEKRKRAKSILQDTSDMGSSLYDSTDNLLSKAPVIVLKRERSSSPLSPAFSPVKHNHNKRAKRRKLSGSVEMQVGSTSSRNDQLEEKYNTSSESANFRNPEFGELFDIIKEYVMVHREEEKVEKVLLAVVRNIWSLKQIQLRELDRELNDGTTELLGSARLSSDRSRGVGTIKRLSNRLKNIMLRRSLTPVVTPSTTPAPELTLSSEQHKVKKPTGRPIHEVVQDILQLDRKYLFRGLSREPVCKYCYEPGGDIERCLSGCNSWLHADCLEKEKTKMPPIDRKSIEVAPNKSPNPITISSSPIVDENIVIKMEADQLIKAEEINEEITKLTLTCLECATGKSHVCCICHQFDMPLNSPPVSPNKETKDELIATQDPYIDIKLLVCSQPMCGKRFHASCCKYWPQASISSSTSRCPMHVCHTCASNDPSSKYQQLGSAKLTKCVKCPATYHQDSHCIPAGSRMLTATHLICPRHNLAKSDANLNVLWCYICVRGGELVCCETCPIAVHAHCRNIPIKTNESYICEECESGRLPLYGEIVWAKFNNFRWWPSIILPPTEVPNNIVKKPHGANDFVVRFFGTNDHGWISRRRVYLYIEGDNGDGYKSKSLISKRYTAGVEEATYFLKIIKAKRQEKAMMHLSGNKLHPPPYIKIKANKPVPPVRFVYNEEDVNICECKAGSEHPCGPNSGCLNRMLYHECNPDFCHAGTRCENQLFELRKSPRLDVVFMNERGFGLICREPIAEGTFVIEYVGEVINHAEFQRRMTQKTHDRDENFYFLGVEKDFIIDAGPKGNLARFMNHSCDPNCATQKWTVNCINRVGIFAIKDIPENTELTFNYLWDDLMNNGKKACFCGAKRCSGEIGGKLKDESVKESNTQTAGKSRTNAKQPKQVQRSKSVRINVGPTKKKGLKKSKSKPDSVENVPTAEPPPLQNVSSADNELNTPDSN